MDDIGRRYDVAAVPTAAPFTGCHKRNANEGFLSRCALASDGNGLSMKKYHRAGAKE